MKQTDVAIAVVSRAGDILVCQRRPDGPLGGYWEFPGGKREPDETITHCLVRELREELGIDVRPIAPLTPIEHDYPHARVRLHPFVCVLEPESPEPQAIACQSVVWVAPRQLREYRFPPANDTLLAEAIAYFTKPRHPTPPAVR